MNRKTFKQIEREFNDLNWWLGYNNEDNLYRYDFKTEVLKKHCKKVSNDKIVLNDLGLEYYKQLEKDFKQELYLKLIITDSNINNLLEFFENTAITNYEGGNNIDRLEYIITKEHLINLYEDIK